MKTQMAFFVILFSSLFSLQAQETLHFSATLPYEYEKAAEFALVSSNSNDTIMTFNRKGNINFIKINGENYVLKKRKTLFDAQGDTIAFYKKRKIVFPAKNIVVTEKRSKNCWTYYKDNEKILEINYSYNKKDKKFYITASTKKLDEITTAILQISIGRFDKQVSMQYETEFESTLTTLIAILVS